MRRAVTTALVVLLFFGSIGAGASGAAQSESSESNTTIRVSAVGEAESEPNQAVVLLSVVQSASDAETVRERLAQNSSRMQSALRETNIGDEQIRTVSFDISEDQSGDESQPEFRGIHIFEITVNDTSRVGEIIDTAVQNGASEVSGVEFTLSDNRTRELRATALETAMQSARTDAETIAGAENLSVVGVRNVSTVEPSFVPVEARTTTAANAGGETNVEPGPVTVSVQVVVTYEARESDTTRQAA
ncbi:SIMPL domain-containing protein [Haladaptatus cibarius]|uniref:SIMPL domain-containing protein n=1 Tax=Haladaptatus cibarius TaxID=453847 RepID=UPI0006784385|nr:SIMPL domain-containing protein [Haladaptatus cibarius]